MKRLAFLLQFSILLFVGACQQTAPNAPSGLYAGEKAQPADSHLNRLAAAGPFFDNLWWPTMAVFMARDSKLVPIFVLVEAPKHQNFARMRSEAIAVLASHFTAAELASAKDVDQFFWLEMVQSDLTPENEEQRTDLIALMRNPSFRSMSSKMTQKKEALVPQFAGMDVDMRIIIADIRRRMNAGR